MALPESPPMFSPAQGLNRAMSQSPTSISEALPSFKQTINSDEDLEQEIRFMKGAIAGGEAALKLRSSFDTAYWMRASEIVSEKLKLNQLRQRKYSQFLQVTIDGFGQTEEGLDLFNEKCALEVEGTLVQEQIRSFGAESTTLKSFVEVFTTSSPSGFNIRHSGKRDRKRQRQRQQQQQQMFADDLILKQESKHPTPEVDYYWCPILCDWFTKAAMIAAPLISWRCGPHAMRVIFEDDTTGNTELFKAENGIYWSQEAERRFSAGLFVIVPDVPENPTDSWEQSSRPKDYKIMVLDPYHKLMTRRLSPRSSEIWGDKHDQRVEFRSDARPRERYLYFAYCEALLKRSFVYKALRGDDITREEARKRCWGITTG
ncbi:MAG: hypothetical protein Q9193_007056, partial [Seirophora villosa]